MLARTYVENFKQGSTLTLGFVKNFRQGVTCGMHSLPCGWVLKLLMQKTHVARKVGLFMFLLGLWHKNEIMFRYIYMLFC